MVDLIRRDRICISVKRDVRAPFRCLIPLVVPYPRVEMRRARFVLPSARAHDKHGRFQMRRLFAVAYRPPRCFFFVSSIANSPDVCARLIARARASLCLCRATNNLRQLAARRK